MICPNCQKENPAANRFCGHCGQGLAQACPSCGSENPPGQRFCGQCGTDLGSTDAEPVTTTTTERRLVTVLFADLTGYTSFAEKRDSEDTRRFLGTYFDRSREIVERFGGIVEKFIGDAVMAVWGADVAHEDDAERAVRAGFELTDLVAKLASEEGASHLALRVGINTGEAAVGPGEGHMGFVTGDLVNTASRLESAAQPGTVLVGKLTQEAASRAVAFEPAGDQALKGKSEKVPTWRAMRVLSEVGGRGRAEALEPPFVGRAEELRLLKDLRDTVGRESRARMVSLVGEAGIGKSRLVWEFLKWIDGLIEDTYWHEGRSPSYGDGVTFWAVAEMIRRRAGIRENDPNAEAAKKLDETLEQFVDDQERRAWIRPRVMAVLGIGEAPPGDRAELDAAVRAFFEGVASRGTTVLVFQDLHWADPAMLDFVEDLTDWWRDQPILVITESRQDLLDRRPTFGTSRQGVISSTLGALSDTEMTEMVNRTVPGLPEAVVSAIVGRAAGVPLYAVELLRNLLATGDIEEDGESYRMVGDVSDLAVPESLQAIIGARLDRLDGDEKRLVQDAAILGHAFSLDALAVITGEPTEALEPRIQQLCRRELIERVRDFQSPEVGQYRFLQGMIRDVAIGRMSKENRRRRHLAVAEHMEGQLDPEIAVVVASHYLQALEATGDGSEHEEIKAKALTSVVAAASRAADLGSWEQVQSTSEIGLDLAEDDSERAPFWEAQLDAHANLSNRDMAEKYGQMAVEFHRSAGNETDMWRVMHKLGLMYTNLGLRDKAVQLLSEVVHEDAPIESDRELAIAATVFCRASMLQNLPVGPFLDRAIHAAERLDLRPQLLDALITKSGFADFEGRHTESIILLKGAVQMAMDADLTAESARGLNNLAFQLAAIDEEASLQAQNEAMEIARKSGNRPIIQWHLMQHGFGQALRGRVEKMEEIHEDPMWVDAGPDILAGRRFYESMAWLLVGDYEQARQMMDESSDLMDHTDPQSVAWLDAGRVMQAAFEGDPSTSLNRLEELEGKDWWQAIGSAWPILLSLILLGEPRHLAKVREVYEPFLPRFHQEIALVGALEIASTEPDLAADRIEELVRVSEQTDNRFTKAMQLMGAAQFLPGTDPRRSQYQERARSFTVNRGLNGLTDLIDRRLVGR